MYLWSEVARKLSGTSWLKANWLNFIRIYVELFWCKIYVFIWMIEFSQKFLFSENLYSYFLGLSIVYRTNNNPLSISRRPDARLDRMEYESVILPMVATYRDLNLNGRLFDHAAWCYPFQQKPTRFISDVNNYGH